MDNQWMLSRWVSRVVLACALLMFLASEGVVIAASLGWPNGPAAFAARSMGQLLVNAFLTSIPFVAALWGSMRVNRLRSTLDTQGEEAALVWLWRQYFAGTVFAYIAIISIVTSLAEAFHPR